MTSQPKLLVGRHALVCGASAGIGRACAVALAAHGARVTALAVAFLTLPAAAYIRGQSIAVDGGRLNTI